MHWPIGDDVGSLVSASSSSSVGLSVVGLVEGAFVGETVGCGVGLVEGAGVGGRLGEMVGVSVTHAPKSLRRDVPEKLPSTTVNFESAVPY
mgnify:CR=1 FL=1